MPSRVWLRRPTGPKNPLANTKIFGAYDEVFAISSALNTGDNATPAARLTLITLQICPLGQAVYRFMIIAVFALQRLRRTTHLDFPSSTAKASGAKLSWEYHIATGDGYEGLRKGRLWG